MGRPPKAKTFMGRSVFLASSLAPRDAAFNFGQSIKHSKSHQHWHGKGLMWLDIGAAFGDNEGEN